MVAIEQPHRRYNPLTGQWVLVSPQRTRRPWQGRKEKRSEEQRPRYDPDCYLCPGNARAGGVRNPEYEHTFVFTNDFAALLPDTQTGISENSTLFGIEAVRGTCRVICFSPRHDLTLAEMLPEEIRRVVDLWAAQIEELGKKYRWIQIFENKGAMMGASNPHPHGQLWAGNRLPNEPAREDRQQKKYFEEHRSVLLLDYLHQEQKRRERIVIENEHWVVMVPFWAIWPFEILLLPRRHILRLPDLTDPERQSLAQILKRHLSRYDNLFRTAFPYTMGWHGAPTDAGDYAHWQMHAHYYPPLLRSATIRKFMVGYELLSEPQRDITAEEAAARLRDLPGQHYKQQ